MVLYDATGKPLFVYYTKRGVKPKLYHKSARTVTSKKTATRPADVLDRIAYVSIRADNKGNGPAFYDHAFDAIEQGIYDGLQEVTKKWIANLAPEKASS